MICYVKTFESGQFKGFNNNFANITLTTDSYGQSVTNFSKDKYSCLNISNLTPDKTSQPIAHFENITKFLNFMIARLRLNLPQIINPTTGIGLTKYYVCSWPIQNAITSDYFDQNLSQYSQLEKTFNSAYSSAGLFGLPVENVKEIQKNDKVQQTNIKNANSGNTNPQNNLNTTTPTVTCPPPTITSFSPLTGISGTILTIVGKDLDQITGVTINNVTTNSNITINNSFNISVVVPFSNTPVQQQNPIIVRGVNGNSTSQSGFTYNPEQLTPSTPSTPPGLPPNVNTQPQQTGHYLNFGHNL